MKVKIDQWCQVQNKTKTASSRDNDDPTALDSASGGAKSFNDALVILRTKYVHIFNFKVTKLFPRCLFVSLLIK